TGKNVGSVTLYDSPNYGSQNKNPRHKYAMQPLTLKIANKDGFGDYQSGLEADISVSENFANMKSLGDPTELFLATAISEITGIPLPPTAGREQFEIVVPISDSKKMIPLKPEMYLKEVP